MWGSGCRCGIWCCELLSCLGGEGQIFLGRKKGPSSFCITGPKMGGEGSLHSGISPVQVPGEAEVGIRRRLRGWGG